MIESVWLLNYIGMVTGGVGVIIAIYLQLISPKHCPPQYVVFYLVVGTGLMLIHLNGALMSSVTAIVLRLAGYTILIAIQVGSAYHIYQRMDNQSSTESLEEIISLNNR